MKRFDKFIVLAAWSLLGLMSPVLARAQYPNGFELLCPAGAAGAAFPLPNGVTYNPTTGLSRAWVCADTSGNVTSPVFAATGGGVSSIFGATGAIVNSTTFTNEVGFTDPLGASLELENGVGGGTGYILADAGGFAGIETDVVQSQLELFFNGLAAGNVICGTSIAGPTTGCTFSQTPAFPTASAGTSTTAAATTSFVATSFATKASPTFTGTVTAPKLTTTVNCSSSASPAVCTSAGAGSVALPTGSSPTLVVNTTAVTANSQIFLQVDESLGTKLSVTCNTTASTLLNPIVTARSAGTSFTFTIGAVIATNPACVSFEIVN